MSVSNYKIEDRILLKKADREGCRQSLAIIYRKYRSTVYNYLKRAGADGMVEDICQSVFVRLSEGRCNYDTQIAADNFLCAVARNILRDHRKVKKEIPYPPKQIEDLYSERMIDIQPDSLETAEEYQFLKNSIAKLPTKSRQAIESTFLDASKGRDAMREHASDDPDVFKMRLRYAIKLLRGKFNDL